MSRARAHEIHRTTEVRQREVVAPIASAQQGSRAAGQPEQSHRLARYRRSVRARRSPVRQSRSMVAINCCKRLRSTGGRKILNGCRNSEDQCDEDPYPQDSHSPHHRAKHHCTRHGEVLHSRLIQALPINTAARPIAPRLKPLPEMRSRRPAGLRALNAGPPTHLVIFCQAAGSRSLNRNDSKDLTA